jgi:hypothetical protein
MKLRKNLVKTFTVATILVGFSAVAGSWSTCQPSRCSQTGVGGFSTWQDCQNYVNSMNRSLGRNEERWKNCVGSN